MTTGGQQLLRFGDFELDAGRRLLRAADSGATIPMTPRVFDTLLVLVEHAGDVVDKRVLLETVWPSVIVEENNLTQAISALRRALGERAGEQRYIVTVPGRGYRFVANVQEARAEVPNLAVAGPEAAARDDAFRRPSDQRWRAMLLFGSLFAGVAILGGAWLVQRAVPGSGSAPTEPLLTNHQRVSLGPGNHGAPALSPDGSRVAFVSDRSGIPQIWVRNLRFGEAVQITFDAGAKSAPSWSVDDRIAFTRHRGNGPPQSIAWVDTQGTLEPTTIIEQAGFGRYSFDGTRIVFERGFEIWMADADGSNQRRVAGVPRRDWVFEWTRPALSPDGQWIAFYLQDTGVVGDIWIIPAGGGTAAPLTQERQHMGGPVWGPNGRYIYFSSRRGGTWNLWRIGVDGGAIEAVTSGVGEDREPAISRAGDLLVYQNTRTSTTFQLADPGTGVTQALPSDGHLSWHANVSHDGTRFAYFSEVAPREQVFVMNVDGTGRRQLTFGDQHEANVMPRWLHDDASLLYYEALNSRTLRQIPVTGGPATTLIEDFGWEENMWLDWSPAGNRYSYVRTALEGGERIVVTDAETGDERLLGPARLTYARFSPDGGDMLGFGPAGIVVCVVDTGDCEVLNADADLAAQWSRDGTRIFFTKPRSEAPQWSRFSYSRDLFVMNRDGGNVRDLNVTLGPMSGSDGPFQVAAGDRILWNRYSRADSELWSAVIPD